VVDVMVKLMVKLMAKLMDNLMASRISRAKPGLVATYHRSPMHAVQGYLAQKETPPS
jgi:hypothetical protein